MKLYVASSWRNINQPITVNTLKEKGYDVYDFRQPTEKERGFHWYDIDPEWENWCAETYVDALKHPVVKDAFTLDFNAMKECDVCVLLLPCGRSAHLEAGYFVGAGKPLFIVLDDCDLTAELMYKMATKIVCCTSELLLELDKYEKDMLHPPGYPWKRQEFSGPTTT